jgi:hypothetical protein
MDTHNNVKLIASQAHTINKYKNMKIKLMLCCANIYFNIYKLMSCSMVVANILSDFVLGLKMAL